MNILVTGGMGEIGQPTVKYLLSRGHHVRVLDLHVDTPIPGADCRVCDITDYEALREHLADIDAVVHLAAVRHPGLAPQQEIFHINCGGTFNVYTAAAAAGVKRVVCASSINALGYNFSITPHTFKFQYFPIDEDHPTYTTDVYSFSKHTIEEIGAYFWRREGISSVLLRFPAVYDTDEGKTPLLKGFVIGCNTRTAEVIALPPAARQERARDIVDRYHAKARAREWEEGFDLSFPDAHIMFGRSNFWTSLDVRDAALAIEKGLLTDLAGSHAVYVTDTQNFTGLPSRELAAVFFPEVTTWKTPVEGTDALVSIAKAKALIGFEPQYPFDLK